MSFNKVIIVGNLGGDVELRYTPQGTAVANVSIATNSRQKVGEGYENIATWFKVTLWRQAAENAAKYLTKGSPLFVEGELTTETWQDKDGNNRFNLKINASDMKFIGGKQDGERQGDAYEGEGESTAPAAFAGPPAGTDDIPF